MYYEVDRFLKLLKPLISSYLFIVMHSLPSFENVWFYSCCVFLNGVIHLHRRRMHRWGSDHWQVLSDCPWEQRAVASRQPWRWRLMAPGLRRLLFLDLSYTRTVLWNLPAGLSRKCLSERRLLWLWSLSIQDKVQSQWRATGGLLARP